MSGSWITQDRLLIAVVTGVMGVLPACVEDTPTTVESDDDPPSVNITAPARNSAFSKGDVIEFAATVEDATDGTLTGGNLVWSSDLDGELGTGTPLAVSRLRTGVHVVTLLARDYNSGLAANEVTVFVYPVEYGRVNQAPEITITRPQSDEVFPVGEEIVFEGYGIDPEEGPMPDDELRWSLCSSLTSRCTSIGLGPRQTKTDLAPLGRYSVTLEATDYYQETGWSQTRIWVYDPAEPCSAPVSLDADPVRMDPGGVATVGLQVEQPFGTWHFARLGDGPVDTVTDVLTAHGFDYAAHSDRNRVLSLQFRDDLSPGSYYSLEVTVVVSAAPAFACRIPLNLEIVASAGFNSPPVPMINRPAHGSSFAEEDVVPFRGRATDAQDGVLGDPALSWTSDLDGPIGVGRALDRTLSVGTHTITLTATDSGALTGATFVSIDVVASNAAPDVAITSPADGSTFTSGQSIDLQGSATDAEDGALTGASLAWTSDRDGPLGSGETFARDDLSVGDHTITLTATDSDGSDASASVNITVSAPAAPTAVIAGAVLFAATPLPDITVTLSGEADRTQMTTSIGQFLFMDLAAGTYTVTISNYPTYANFPFTSQTVTLGDGERETIIFRAP